MKSFDILKEVVFRYCRCHCQMSAVCPNDSGRGSKAEGGGQSGGCV